MSSIAVEVERTPEQVINSALERFSQERIAISFSGAEDVVLIDMASRLVGTSFSVFTLDTGRLHAETYEFIDKVRDHYGIQIDVLSPDNWEVEALVREKGLFSFYRDGHTQCCGIRKIASLERKLNDLDAWITGQRRDQGINENKRSPRADRYGFLLQESRDRQVQSISVVGISGYLVLYP